MRRFIPFVFLVALVVMPFSARAAVLSVSPSTGTFEEGQRIIVNIQVSSDVAMNAASGVLTFPKDLLTVEYVNKGSVLNFWVTEPSYSNTAGTVKFEGVSLSGFQGSNGSILTVAFRAKKAGSAQVSFQAGQLLANDGQGTDITNGLNGGTYTLNQVTRAPANTKPAPQPEPIEEAVPEPVQPAPKPQGLVSPVIALSSQQGLPTIIGESAYAKSDVLVTFTAGDGSKIFISGSTDADGSFASVVPRVLRSGSYHVTAVIVLPNGVATDPSSPLLVPVGGIVSIDLGWNTLLYIFLLLLVIGVGLMYVALRMRSKKPLPQSRVVREAREAETVLHKSFALLRQDLRSYLKDKRRSRTGSADDDLESLSEDLDQAEEFIEKEIRDIESSLHK